MRHIVMPEIFRDICMRSQWAPQTPSICHTAPYECRSRKINLTGGCNRLHIKVAACMRQRTEYRLCMKLHKGSSVRISSATIRDVANEAGVSVASVSRTINGHSSVHPKTRDHVLAVAKAMGYVPHAAARSLSLSRSHAIGVVLPDLHGEFFSEIVRGMDREVTRRGYHLLLSNMHADPARAAQAVRSMRGRVDGLIVMAPQLDREGLKETLPADMPAVLINSHHDGTHAAFRVDNKGGIEACIAHLVSIGRRRLVHVSGPSGNIDADERREAFLDFMKRLVPDQEPIVIEGDFRESSGAAAVATLLSMGVQCDGIVSGNDMMALGILSTLRNSGISVPESIAVTGFDDVPLSRYLGLTTMRTNLEDMGAMPVAKLVDNIEGSDTTAPITIIPATIVVRSSSVVPKFE